MAISSLRFLWLQKICLCCLFSGLAFVCFIIFSNTPNVIRSHIHYPETLKKTKKILVVSFYRSGSSWFGSLISKSPKTFYVFEPLHIIGEEHNTTQELSHTYEFYVGYKRNRLRELFHCGISKYFSKHAMKWKAVYRNPNCIHKSCITPINITRSCTSSNFIIIKVLRILLYEVEDLLRTTSLEDLKVIYLVRDPRGSANSLRHMKSRMRLHTDHLCTTLRENTQFYSILKAMFPNQIMFLRYEDIAKHPIEKASEVWRFMSGEEESSPPEEWTKFIEISSKHKKRPKIGSFNISNKSTQDWQAWRKDITVDLLRTIENDCQDVLQTLGYATFYNIESAKNLSNPVLVVNDCKNIPCNKS